MSFAVHGTTLDELGGADELDGTTELLLGATLEELSASLEELGWAKELELLPCPPSTLDELGGADELDGTDELLLGSSLPEEEDGSPPLPSPDDEQESVNAIANTMPAADMQARKL